MKIIQRLFLIVILLNSPLAYGYDVINIKNFDEITAHIAPQTLVIFGGLNTLFKTNDPAR